MNRLRSFCYLAAVIFFFLHFTLKDRKPLLHPHCFNFSSEEENAFFPVCNLQILDSLRGFRCACITIRLLNWNTGEIFVHAARSAADLRKEFVPTNGRSVV